jgi:hypothetical protein
MTVRHPNIALGFNIWCIGVDEKEHAFFTPIKTYKTVYQT